MEFPIVRRKPKHDKFENDVLDITYKFAASIHKELGDIIRAIVLFGSAVKKDDPHDIDVLVIVDDIHIAFTAEMQQAYRIIVTNCVRSISSRLHVTTLRFSNFWEYVRISDPVLVSVLRSGVPIIDTGFFSPLQLLLQQGRIRPTPEAVWAYYSRSPQLLLSSKAKLLHAVIDLYWAAIDSAHAALMACEVVPQSPEHVPGLLKEKLVDKGLLEDEYPDILRTLYYLQKDIYARRIESISGSRIDALHERTKNFVNRMRLLLPE